MSKETVQTKYLRSKKGVIAMIYTDQIKSSKKRGHIPPPYSKEELTKWLYQNNFDSLFSNWADSGYKKIKKPSVDRLDDYIGYRLDNIQLITWEENLTKKRPLLNKPVRQIKDGVTVNEFESMTVAANSTGLYKQSISNVINGRLRTTGGFVWELIK